tara:strand:+ start:18562 stop:18687 length:126 start_codon:yes stop_codon:yes gene_type:complete
MAADFDDKWSVLPKFGLISLFLIFLTPERWLDAVQPSVQFP